ATTEIYTLSLHDALPILLHESFVLDVAFSPDSRLLLTVSSDNTARVWDVAEGEPVTPRLVNDSQVLFGSWSPDGNEVLTGSADGTVRVWDVSPTTADTPALIEQARLLSAHRVAESKSTVPLDTPEMARLWE